MKAATISGAIQDAAQKISIHAAREGGDVYKNERLRRRYISIHAAREGGDEIDATSLRAFLISIHAAREGGDGKFEGDVYVHVNFNPRRP